MGPANLCCSLLSRQLTGKAVLGRPFLADLTCAGPTGGTISVNPSGVGAPPFAAKFSETLLDSKLLAIADEEGNISIVDAGGALPPSLFEEEEELRPMAQWLAHRNAVFDLTWAKDDALMLTASGDQSVGLWDTAEARCLGSCRGHDGSVKSVSVHPDCHNIFASGARDGALMVWDSRSTAHTCPRTQQACYAPVMKVQDAHRLLEDTKGRQRSAKKGTKHSVTSVLFLHEGFHLASAGAADGVVKFWDIRKLTGPAAELAPARPGRSGLDAVAAIGAGHSSGRPHGITCLTKAPTGSGLLVSVSDHTHYMYDALRPELPPSRSYRGHRTSSFYVKTAFSPDGTHIMSGSSDRNVYIWQVDRPSQPPYVLAGHTSEVTAVAWCPTDFGMVASCADDFSVKLWAINRPWPARSTSTVPCTAPKEPSHTPGVLARPAMATPVAYAPATPGPAAPQSTHRLADQNDPPLNMAGPAPEWNGFAAASAGPSRTPLTPCTNLQTPQTQALATAAKQRATSAGAMTQRSIRDFFCSPAAGCTSPRPAKKPRLQGDAQPAPGTSIPMPASMDMAALEVVQSATRTAEAQPFESLPEPDSPPACRRSAVRQQPCHQQLPIEPSACEALSTQHCAVNSRRAEAHS